jgi:hypothetical protein
MTEPTLVLRPAFNSYVRASFALNLVVVALLVFELFGHAFTRPANLFMWIAMAVVCVGLPLSGYLRSRLSVDATHLRTANWLGTRREYPRQAIRSIAVERSGVAFLGPGGEPVHRVSRGMWQDEQLVELSRHLGVPITGRRRDADAPL